MIKIKAKTARLLGLDKDMILVLKALQKEVLTVTELSRATMIPRTTLYYMLANIEGRGLIKKVKTNKIIRWKIISYDELPDEYSPGLEPVGVNTNPNKKNITILRGKKDILNIFRSISKLPPNNRFYGIQPKESIIHAMTNANLNEIINLNEKIKEKGLIVDGIIHESGTDSMLKALSPKERVKLLKSFGDRTAETAKLPEDFLAKTKADIYFYDKNVAIVNWYKEFGIIIKDKDVFELLKEMFDSLKQQTNRYNQNEKIANKLKEESN